MNIEAKNTVITAASKLDLNKIANSGQCFRWQHQQHSNTYIIPVLDTVAELKQAADNRINIMQNNTGNNFTQNMNIFWTTYLDANRNYDDMYQNLMSSTQDETLRKAYSFSYGIHILNQPFFETCISFLISQNNNIPRIKNTINKICSVASKANNDKNSDTISDNMSPYPFPNAEKLLKLVHDDIDGKLGLGYRKEYIEQFCKHYLNGEFAVLEKISPLYNVANKTKTCSLQMQDTSSSDIIDVLKQYKGIGEKVACCIALFSLGCIDCIPKDVWIKRAEQQYDINWIPEYAGYQQQLIFYAQQCRII